MLLDIMVDDSRTTSISEQCLCTMFSFQLGSLHISKDVSYDSNNFIVNSVYLIPMTSLRGRWWVVGVGIITLLPIVLLITFKKHS
jgi:hypothetical protein